MTSLVKNLSNTASTGGAGNLFEIKVISSFCLIMLADGFMPCFRPFYPITKVLTQGKRHDYNIDDCIVFVGTDENTNKGKLLCQIKRSIKFTAGDPNFQELIVAAWNDFLNKDLFTVGKDAFAVITGPILQTYSHFRELPEFARSHNNAEHFFREIETNKAIGKEKKKCLDVFAQLLKLANKGEEVSKEQAFRFIQHFYILNFDLDIEAGVHQSLLYSVIGRNSSDDVHSIWAKVVYEISRINSLPAAPIVKETFSDDIRHVFQRKVEKNIPHDLIERPKSDENEILIDEHDKEDLLLFALLGSWSEDYDNDKNIITQLSKKSYSDWQKIAKRLLNKYESVICYKHGVWSVKNKDNLWDQLGSWVFDEQLDQFLEQAKTVLSEIDPQYDNNENHSPIAQRKFLSYSSKIRRGITETLAFIVTKSCLLKHSSSNKIVLVVRQILKNANWKLWASLNDLLPLLAEAAPREFLDALDESFAQNPCPFDHLFELGGKSYIFGRPSDGLLKALETLAWKAEFLARVAELLADLAQYDDNNLDSNSNGPIGVLNKIFLPWLPQTSAEISDRKLIIQNLYRNNSKVTTDLLLTLLPEQTTVASCSREPQYQNWISEEVRSHKVTRNEYFEQIKFFSNILAEHAKNDFNFLIRLVSYFSVLSKSEFEDLVRYLLSDSIMQESTDNLIELWEAMTVLVVEHKKYAHTHWALSSEAMNKLESILTKLKPTDKPQAYKILFSQDDYQLHEESGKWSEQQEKLERKRQEALSQILECIGIKNTIEFCKSVEAPFKAGFALGFIENVDLVQELLPSHLIEINQQSERFIHGFVWGRYSNKGYAWVESISMVYWNFEQIGLFLSYLPFDTQTWDYVNQFLTTKNENYYWQNVIAFPYQTKGDLEPAIKKLIKFKRPSDAVQCLYKLAMDKKRIDAKLCCKALIEHAKQNDSKHSLSSHYIITLIALLQSQEDTDTNDLEKVELAYIDVIDKSPEDVRPITLERKLSSEPEFYCEEVSLIYKPITERTNASSKNLTDKQQKEALFAFKLLRNWKMPPGLQFDGSFDETQFDDWLHKVKSISTKTGHLDMALFNCGKVLIYTPKDQNGLWINQVVAKTLNEREAKELRRGYLIGMFNSRGVVDIEPSAAPELKLSSEFSQQANELKAAGLNRFAETLKDLADQYKSDAERIINTYGKDGNHDEG